MKTSYFANINKLQSEGYTNIISVSQGESKWHKGNYKCYKSLAPSWDIINEADEQIYTKRYITEILSKLDAKKVYDDLGEDAVLICFEKPNDFCHRQIIARWFEAKLGIKVEEFIPYKKKEEVVQLSLFE